MSKVLSPNAALKMMEFVEQSIRRKVLDEVAAVLIKLRDDLEPGEPAHTSMCCAVVAIHWMRDGNSQEPSHG